MAQPMQKQFIQQNGNFKRVENLSLGEQLISNLACPNSVGQSATDDVSLRIEMCMSASVLTSTKPLCTLDSFCLAYDYCCQLAQSIISPLLIFNPALRRDIKFSYHS